MKTLVGSLLIAAAIFYYAQSQRYQIVILDTQPFPARFDSLKGELQTKKMRLVNGVSKMAWGDSYWDVENGKLNANLQ